MTSINVFVLFCLRRDSTEEPLELSEDERNELMKKESSRLLKTGHRVSYSPRKEKALKIYLDGGPAKDPGQDWGVEKHSWVICFAWVLQQSIQAAGLWMSGPTVTWNRAALWGLCALTLHPELQAQKPYCAL